MPFFLRHVGGHFLDLGGTKLKTPLQCFDKNKKFCMIKQKFENRASWASKTPFFTDIHENILKYFIYNVAYLVDSLYYM